jgi:hypothetical protein
MDNKASSNVFFEDPFWVCIFQREINGYVQVSRVVFPKEPTDSQILEFIFDKYSFLSFSKPIAFNSSGTIKKTSVKRKIKEAKREMGRNTIGTKAQIALKIQYEEKKKNQKTIRKIKNEYERNKIFNLKKAKRKEKHRGH